MPPKNLCYSSETITNKSLELRVTKQKLHLLSQFLLLKNELKGQIEFDMQQNVIILFAFQKELEMSLLD